MKNVLNFCRRFMLNQKITEIIMNNYRRALSNGVVKCNVKARFNSLDVYCFKKDIWACCGAIKYNIFVYYSKNIIKKLKESDIL